MAEKLDHKQQYGSVPDSPVSPAPECQAPQDIADKHGTKYDNIHPSDWVRGYGKKMHPYFDFGSSGKRYDKGK